MYVYVHMYVYTYIYTHIVCIYICIYFCDEYVQMFTITNAYSVQILETGLRDRRFGLDFRGGRCTGDVPTTNLGAPTLEG